MRTSKTKKLRVIVKEPNKDPYIKDIDNKLSAFQEIVGGLIEVVYIADRVIMVVNEEGKLIPLEPNFDFGDDVIMGTCFFVSEDMTGNFRSLTQDMIEALLSKHYPNPINSPKKSFEIFLWEDFYK